MYNYVIKESLRYYCLLLVKSYSVVILVSVVTVLDKP